MEVMQRDLDVFKVLTFGPALILEMLAMLKKEYGHEKLTLAALRQRLFRLIRAGYIVSRRYRTSKSCLALYSMREKAIEALAMADVSIEKMRVELPGKHTIEHELAVTRVLRSIHRERGQFRYRYDYVSENILRQKAGQNDTKGKDHYFADLLVRIEIGESWQQLFLIEVDKGTIPAFRFAKKIESLSSDYSDHLILVLCETGGRIERLRDALLKYTHLPLFSHSSNIIFATINAFRRTAFTTELIKLDGKRGTLRFPGEE